MVPGLLCQCKNSHNLSLFLFDYFPRLERDFGRKDVCISATPNDTKSERIFSLSPDFREKRKTNDMNSITGISTLPGKEQYGRTNWGKVSSPEPMPSPDVTGYRGSGTMYDTSDMAPQCLRPPRDLRSDRQFVRNEWLCACGRS